MKQDILKLVGLQGFILYRMREEVNIVVLGVGRPQKTARCSHCGQTSRHVHQRARKARRIAHVTVSGRRIVIEVKPRRFRCGNCGRVFTEPLPGVRARSRRTVGAELEAVEELRTGSFGAVRQKLGMAYGTATRFLKALAPKQRDLGKLLAGVDEAAIGIDEHSFRGRDLVMTVTLLQPARQLVAILDDDRVRTLEAYLRGLPEETRAKIRWACTDMKPAFKNAVKRLLPATVVLDHFRVIQDANRRLDEARLLEQEMARRKIPRLPLLKNSENLTAKQQEQLAAILRTYPTLAALYWFKESLRDLYCQPTRAEAELMFARILTNAENADYPEIVRWARTLRQWKPEILPFFYNPINNGFTEGVHTKIKSLKRLSYGFRNRDTYVRKMMLAFLPPLFLACTSHLLTQSPAHNRSSLIVIS